MSRYLIGIYKIDGDRTVKNFSITCLDYVSHLVMQKAFFVYNLTDGVVVKAKNKESIRMDDFQEIMKTICWRS
jgi:hypothetical protein